MELGGRVHLQYNTSSEDKQISSEFLLRRARIWVAARINDWMDASVLVDMAGSKASARYAFLRFTPSPALHVSLGQFKRAFDLFELTSSAQMLTIERDGDVRGMDGCAGVGGPCSFSRFSEQLGLSSLDIGVLFQGELAGGKLSYLASVTNGTGPNTRENNGTKSYSGRLEWHVSPKLKLGANAALHDYGVEPLVNAYAPATELDLEVGDFTQGFHLQAGVLTGENWRNPVSDGEGTTFLAAQGIAAYRVPLSGERVKGIEPVARLSWGDPDTDTAGDGGVLVTPGVVLHFEGRNKLAANLDAWRPKEGDTAWSLKMQAYVYF